MLRWYLQHLILTRGGHIQHLTVKLATSGSWQMFIMIGCIVNTVIPLRSAILAMFVSFSTLCFSLPPLPHSLLVFPFSSSFLSPFSSSSSFPRLPNSIALPLFPLSLLFFPVLLFFTSPLLPFSFPSVYLPLFPLSFFFQFLDSSSTSCSSLLLCSSASLRSLFLYTMSCFPNSLKSRFSWSPLLLLLLWCLS